jgi:hypothetical protein
VFIASSIALAENPVLKQLVDEGVPVAEGKAVKLPPPTMPDGLDADSQSEILRGVAGRYPIGLFTRESRTAPFTLKKESVKDESGQRIGQTIDLWFVAYGQLGAVDEGQLMEKLTEFEDLDDDSHDLTAAELASRGIALVEATPGIEERYSYFKGPLLNKVLLSGVSRSFVVRQKESTLVASNLDCRFLDDSEFPNQWQSLQTDERGETVVGSPEPYIGFGGYAKATQLHWPAGAVLVESHVVFSEPYGWFRGANLLGSKLPITIQDKVRSFRGRLAKGGR